MKLLFIIDPLPTLNLEGDTSYALMLAAQRGGHEVFTCEVRHLALEHNQAWASVQATTVVTGNDAGVPPHFETAPTCFTSLATFDAVLMRKDPPFDVAYLHATWILEYARGHTLVINDPSGLRELNEHLTVLRFPQLTPPTIVTRDPARLASFLREMGGAIIVKPVDGFGGLGIFLVRAGDPNASSIFETACGGGRLWTLAQRYLPEAVAGDKRIVLVDGAPVGAVLRVPAPDEARGNLHVGGTAVRCEIDDRDREIIAALAPTLKQYGQFFVGIDVIGGMLTEINITSPTGIRHIERLEQRDVAGEVVASIAAAMQRHRAST